MPAAVAVAASACLALSGSAGASEDGASVSELVEGDGSAVAAPDLSKVGELAGEAIFAQICAVCHGAEGEGNPLLKSPSIAGMPSYYLVSQLERYRSGNRGGRADDIHGAQMRAIAAAFDGAAANRVAAHIETMRAFPTVSGLGGDPSKGKVEFAERCMACHRFNGRGEIVFGSPPLVSLPDWYLFEQMQDFRDGRRGEGQGDENGAKMREATDGLDDATIRDIVAYIGELAAGREPRGSIWR